MLDVRRTRVRAVGRWEGASYLILLGIAMPLKYAFAMPLAVRVVGMLHGLLFIAYCVVVWDAARVHGWEWRKSALFYVASLLPFGPFLVESRLAPEDTGSSPGNDLDM